MEEGGRRQEEGRKAFQLSALSSQRLRTALGWRWRAFRERLRRLRAQDSEPGTWNPEPDICGPPLSDEEMVKMYSRSKINLGFSSCGNTHKEGERILQVRLRDFEVPMSGGFYMVEYMEELEEFFEIGKEIVCYRDRDDMVEKVKYYLEHEDEREAIRRAGRERCLRDHTWQKRLADSFAAMGLG